MWDGVDLSLVYQCHERERYGRYQWAGRGYRGVINGIVLGILWDISVLYNDHLFERVTKPKYRELMNSYIAPNLRCMYRKVHSVPGDRFQENLAK